MHATGRPVAVRPSWSRAAGGHVSGPDRSRTSPEPWKNATRASGSLGTRASPTIAPAPATTRTAASSSDTSSPAKRFTAAPPEARGQRTLTTQVNIPGDTFIDDDFAFATRDGLVLELEKNVPVAGYGSLGIDKPFVRSRFDFVMQKAADDSEASPQARMARAVG